MIQVISEKGLCNEGFTSNWEIFLHENNRNYICHRFRYKFAFIHLLYFLTNQEQESCFQQIGSLVARNISTFCLWRVALYFKAMSNFDKALFLHAIPVRIIVLFIFEDLISWSYNTTDQIFMFAIIYCKNISCLQNHFVKQSKNTLKMNTLFNSEGHWGCLQGTLIFGFHCYYKSMAQPSF